MIYKVLVRCYGEKPAAFVKGKKIGDRPNAVRRKVAAVVEAEDSEHASVQGVAHVPSSRPDRRALEGISVASGRSNSFTDTREKHMTAL